MTGDVTINPSASALVMTTEVRKCKSKANCLETSVTDKINDLTLFILLILTNSLIHNSLKKLGESTLHCEFGGERVISNILKLHTVEPNDNTVLLKFYWGRNEWLLDKDFHVGFFSCSWTEDSCMYCWSLHGYNCNPYHNAWKRYSFLADSKEYVVSRIRGMYDWMSCIQEYIDRGSSNCTSCTVYM